MGIGNVGFFDLFLLLFLWLPIIAFLLYLLRLASRFVGAVEKIAEKIGA